MMSNYETTEENEFLVWWEKNYSKWLNKLSNAINRGKFQRVKSLTQSHFFFSALRYEPKVIYNKVISAQNLRLFNYFLGYTSKFNTDFMTECVIKNYTMDSIFDTEFEFDKDGNKIGEKCYDIILRDKPYLIPMPLSKFIEYEYEYCEKSYDFLLKHCSKYLVKTRIIKLLPIHLVKTVSDYKSYLINLKESNILTDFGLYNWECFIEFDRFDIMKFLVEEIGLKISHDWCENFTNDWPCWSDYSISKNNIILEIPIIGVAYARHRYDVIGYLLNLDSQLKRILIHDELILCVSNFELFKLLVSYWDNIDANNNINFWYDKSGSLSVAKINYILDNFNITTENKTQLMSCQMYEANRLVLQNKVITLDTFEIIHRMLTELDNSICLKDVGCQVDKITKCQDRTFLYYKTFYLEKMGSLNNVEKNIDRLKI